MKNRLMATIAFGAALALPMSVANATVFTTSPPTGGTLPSGVTQVGGIVAVLVGANGNQVVSQLAASSLYRGYANFPENGPPAGSAGGNPLLIGTQNGFSNAIVAALGGGLQSAAFRITLFDGDTAPDDFDDGTDNSFLINGVNIGFWSGVATQRTTSDGQTALTSQGLGFGNDILSTGFFKLTDTAGLDALFTSLGSGSLAYGLSDVDPYDNFFDFTQGVDGGLIDTGQGPVVNPPAGAVPEPATWAMMIMGFGLTGLAMRYRRRKVQIAFG